MNSYEMGQIVGFLLLIVVVVSLIIGIKKLYEKLKDRLFINHTKELVKTYVFWSKFVVGIDTIDDFKQKLQTIKTTKVYKNQFNKFYLTFEEGKSQGELLEEITIEELLKTSTYPLYLMIRLENITLYSDEDLQYIKPSANIAWSIVKDHLVHLIIDDGKIIYPVDYKDDDQFRFGYEILYNKNNKIGIYDILNEKIALDFEYTSISSFGNIVEVTKDNKTFECFDLKTNELLFSNNIKKFPNISEELKEKIDLSKIELQDYMRLCPTPHSEEDLISMGLWDAKVAVLKISSDYDEIIENSTEANIRFSYPITADIFNMNKELPVEFKKKNGELLCLGIDFKYLILDKVARDKLPKYQQKHTKEALLEKVLQLTNEEFNRFVSMSDHIKLFTYLSSLNQKELQKFYEYNDSVVKLAKGTQKSAREQFEEGLSKFPTKDLTQSQIDEATLKIAQMLHTIQTID